MTLQNTQKTNAPHLRKDGRSTATSADSTGLAAKAGAAKRGLWPSAPNQSTLWVGAERLSGLRWGFVRRTAPRSAAQTPRAALVMHGLAADKEELAACVYGHVVWK